MATATKKAPKRVKKGLKFHSHYADGNPEWEVKKSRGRGVWQCEIVDCPDYSGTTRVFESAHILAAVAQHQNFIDLMSDHEKYYAGLQDGQIVHYHNGHAAYVRCEAVRYEGKMKLLPIALVGDWRLHDLPKRDPNGSVHWGYYPTMIRSGELMEPNYGNVYESPVYSDRHGVDPRTLDPVDWEPSKLSYDEEHRAAAQRAVERVAEMIYNNSGMDPAELLKRVRDHVTDVIDGMGL